MKRTTPKIYQKDGAGVQGACGDDGGCQRRDQVRNVDNHRQRDSQQVREDREEDGVTELEPDYGLRPSLISGSDSGGSSSDFPSKSSSLSCLMARRQGRWYKSVSRDIGRMTRRETGGGIDILE